MKKKIIAALSVLIMCNSMFFMIVSGSSGETDISIEKVVTDNTNQTVAVTGQIKNPVENQQVTLMIYERGSDYRNTDKILYIDQNEAILDEDNTFTITIPFDMSIAEDTFTVRMGGSNIETPATFDFDLSETDSKYSDFFKNGSISGYTIVEDTNGNGYIAGGVNADNMVEDLMDKLAEGVEVYKDDAPVNSGKLSTGMTIRNEAGDSEITIVIKGDVTGNGSPGLRDVRSFINHIMNGAAYNEAQQLAVKEFIDEKGESIEAVRELLEYIVGNR